MGDTVLDPEPEKPRERQPITHLIFHLLVGKIVECLQNQHPEHHDRIDWLPAGAVLPYRVRCQNDRLNVGPKAFPWYQPINSFERIALRRQCRQSLLRIEKSKLTHLRLPNHAIAHETRTGRSKRLFFEVPLTCSAVDGACACTGEV